MTPIIEVNNIGKKYRISHQRGGYVALRDVIANVVRRPFQFLKHKAKQVIGHTSTREDFWALKDVSFTVEKGEAIGIIGANGAGKSTLLKILSQITPPTEGEIVLHGKVASLLEVGTGFHPELTGRENIFLNGAILGMTKKEISRKFDEIVAFAEVEQFLDTPVKRYSSGMYVRLAFAVAAHMEPEILIVDEVLAVGDAKFQKKCIGRMNEVTKQQGRTVLFVSHNMEAIQKLCTRCVLLENGRVKMVGPTKDVISVYLENNYLTGKGQDLTKRHDRKGSGNIRLTNFFIESNGTRVETLQTGGSYTLCFGYESADGKPIERLGLASAISTEDGTPLLLNWTKYTAQDIKHAPPKGVLRCTITQRLPLAEGMYAISASLFNNDQQEDFIKHLGVIYVQEGDFYKTGFMGKHSPIYLEQDWTVASEK